MAAAAPRFKNSIGGEWVDAAGGETFETIVPATGEVLGSFPRSGGRRRRPRRRRREGRVRGLAPRPGARARRDPLPLRRAPARAQGRADRPDDARDGEGAGRGRRRRPGGDRHELLHGRRGPAPARPDDAERAARQVHDERADAGRRRRRDHAVELPDRDPVVEALPGARVRQHRRAQAGRGHAAARRADSSRCSTEAGLPPGVVNVVHGYGEEAGEALVRHPDVPVITFTGSRETGVAVTKAAADHLKHVHLELGGKNAIVVMDDADVDLAVEGIVWSAFGTSGQRCTAASRVIVHEAVYGELQSKLVAAAERLRLGPGWEDATDVGPLINGAALERVHGYTRHRHRRGREAPHRRRAVRRRGLLLPADRLRRRRPADADRAGGDLRPDDRADPGRGLRRGGRGRELGRSTASRRRSTRATSTARSARCATSRPGSRTSTPARSAPRCTSRSAA